MIQWCNLKNGLLRALEQVLNIEGANHMDSVLSNLAAMATAAGGKILLALLVLIIGNILIKSVL